jgi:hypothetical protein
MDFAELAKVPMASESDMGMVEIIMLKWRCPDVEVECAERIIRNTEWPFKLNCYDNRLNTPNTARIWNKLIRDATCPYVCVIDSDAFVPKVDPCWLTRMMRTFTLHGDCRVVLPMTDRCSTLKQRASEADRYPSVVSHDGEWSGFCFLMRKSLLDEAGPFDERYVGYGQDSDFSVRLARSGGGSYIRPDVWVKHVHGASFMAANAAKIHDAAADREYARRLFLGQ